MSKQQNNGGLLVCGACAVAANPNVIEPTSIDYLCRSIKAIASKFRSTQSAVR